MTKYSVRKIDLSRCANSDEYQIALNNAPVHICNGTKELAAFCGGKLKKERCGYAGIRGDVQYVAVRV